VAELTPADDKETVGALLLSEVEDVRIGGEDQGQYAEFLRSRRLGGAVQEAVRGLRLLAEHNGLAAGADRALPRLRLR